MWLKTRTYFANIFQWIDITIICFFYQFFRTHKLYLGYSVIPCKESTLLLIYTELNSVRADRSVGIEDKWLQAEKFARESPSQVCTYVKSTK